MYERFGSKRGFARFWLHKIKGLAGVYRQYQIQPGRAQGSRYVFVCSGNICRSPLAEVYARSLGMESASCGLNCGDDYPADPRAREFALTNGLSLESHKTVNVRDFKFRQTDLVVVMEPAHLDQFRSKVHQDLPLVLAGNHGKAQSPYIHDPFNCCPAYFARCESMVMECVRGMNA
ncbi:low molecular weight phosphatase family protein [Marinobacter fuscus]|nr:hypothetical protein [Marinobacter fuscus]